MSIREKLAELALLPFTSAVDIRFSSNVKAKTIYQKDYPKKQPRREVEGGHARVETGSTMAFEITEKDSGEVRAIVVDDYRKRSGRNERAIVLEALLDKNGDLYKSVRAPLNYKTPIEHVDGIGVFSWKPGQNE